MDAAPFTRVEHVTQTGSTNTDLRHAVLSDPDAWPHLSVLVADYQVAGRGRAGRSWETPPGVALTASVLLRPGVPGEHLTWATTLTGLAVQRATARLMSARTGLKWPNDVLALDAGEEVPGWGSDRKIGGVLAELATTPGSREPVVVLGIGVNVNQSADQLPVPWAGSMRLVSGRTLAPQEVLTAIGQELVPLVEQWQSGDIAGVREEVSAACVTLGGVVEAHLPGGGTRSGTAESLDEYGALLIRTDSGVEPLMAGDVLHVRKGPPGGV